MKFNTLFFAALLIASYFFCFRQGEIKGTQRATIETQKATIENQKKIMDANVAAREKAERLNAEILALRNRLEAIKKERRECNDILKIELKDCVPL